jgi:hypothetical protein
MRAALVLLLLPSVASAQKPPASRPAIEVRLAVRIAEVEGKPIVDKAFVERQLAVANRIFEPHGVRVRLVELGKLPAAHAELESRADRDRLAAHLHARAVTCFVVRSLRDVDDPSSYRLGVHWKKRRGGAPAAGRSHADDRGGRHYLIITEDCQRSTLAHELVHFFGEPGHRKDRCNLMSYGRGDCEDWLDKKQGEGLRRGAAKLSYELPPAR